jgi:hypothetical protein
MRTPVFATLAAPRRVCAQAAGETRAPVLVVGESPEQRFEAVVLRSGQPVAACTTPCRLRLAPGRYTLRALDVARVLASQLEVDGAAPRRVRLGVSNRFDANAGLAFAMLGVGASAVMVDHLAYVVTPPALHVRPFVGWFIDGIERDVALAPAAFVLLRRGATLMADARGREVVVESNVPRRRARLTGVTAVPLRGGGLLGATIEF